MKRFKMTTNLDFLSTRPNIDPLIHEMPDAPKLQILQALHPTCI